MSVLKIPACVYPIIVWKNYPLSALYLTCTILPKSITQKKKMSMGAYLSLLYLDLDSLPTKLIPLEET